MAEVFEEIVVYDGENRMQIVGVPEHWTVAAVAFKGGFFIGGQGEQLTYFTVQGERRSFVYRFGEGKQTEEVEMSLEGRGDVRRVKTVLGLKAPFDDIPPGGKIGSRRGNAFFISNKPGQKEW